MWGFLWICYIPEIQHFLRLRSYVQAAIFSTHTHVLTNEACLLALRMRDLTSAGLDTCTYDCAEVCTLVPFIMSVHNLYGHKVVRQFGCEKVVHIYVQYAVSKIHNKYKHVQACSHTLDKPMSMNTYTWYTMNMNTYTWNPDEHDHIHLIYRWAWTHTCILDILMWRAWSHTLDD